MMATETIGLVIDASEKMVSRGIAASVAASR